MMKAKEYDWKDSNLALFGSDTEKSVKKESAESEPAWQGAGQEVGLQIWRINKFKVEHWPQEDYGSFYNGDSYIILNTYKEEEEIKYDVHFWIGKYSTQDEYGTAAYKTVELDTLLDDKPVQHREVMNHESQLFKTYFSCLTLLKGGADTGFKRVLPTEYQPRLLHLSGESIKSVTLKEVPTKKGNLKSEDVFVLDLGLKIYQWNGSTCGKDEKFKAAQCIQKLKSERGGKTKVGVLEELSTSKSHEFYASLSDGASKKEKSGFDADFEPKMMRVSDQAGHLEMSLVLEGKLDKDLLTTDDVFILDNGKEAACWIGKGASIDERKNGLSYASNYLAKSTHPFIPITVFSEGQESEQFHAMFY